MIKFVVLLFAVGALGLPSVHKRGLFKNLDESRIIGGSDAYDGQYPYQVSVKRYDIHHCGGSIINERSILSAAHCYYIYSISGFTVVPGTVKLSNDQAPVYKVSAFRQHVYFNSYTSINDISILKLDRSIEYNSKVQPIAMNTDHIGSRLYAVLTGWGYTHPSVVPDNLKRIDLATIDNNECAARLRTPIIDSQICTLAAYGYGACHGDSGGPLVFNGRQIGVVSYGRPCALGLPDVFTRITSFLDWVQMHSQ